VVAAANHVGDRSGRGAQALWQKIPAGYQMHAVFYADQYAGYTGMTPSACHRVVTKLARTTIHVECFDCPLRQRVSRLARLPFHCRRTLPITSEPSSISFAIITSPGVQPYQDSTSHLRVFGTHFVLFLFAILAKHSNCRLVSNSPICQYDIY
jgi:IS1 family transposase